MTDTHTAPAKTVDKPKRRHRSPHGLGQLVTDQELCEWLGVPPYVAMPVLEVLDRDTSKGFPQKQKLWGDRRYLKAVEQWFDARYGLKLASSRRDQ